MNTFEHVHVPVSNGKGGGEHSVPVASFHSALSSLVWPRPPQTLLKRGWNSRLPFYAAC